MDERINRFRYCDPRFYKYLDQVLQRMPESIREEIMGKENIQSVAQPDLPDICGRHFEFDPPLKILKAQKRCDYLGNLYFLSLHGFILEP
ncbi:MAG: hypothetical protein P8165_18320 [Deltaproteobacteria bacterium]